MRTAPPSVVCRRGQRRRALVAVAVAVVAAAVAGLAAPNADPSAASDPTSHQAPAPTQPLPPLRARVRPDVLVRSPRPLGPAALRRLRALARGGFTTVRAGTATLAGVRVAALGVDAGGFRAFAPKGTAEATPVWEAVARGEAVVSHDLAKRRRLALGEPVAVRGRTAARLRLGAYASTGLPDVALVVSDEVAGALGLPAASGAVLASGRGDPAALAAAVRRVVGDRARIDLLAQPSLPRAVLTGGAAARAFGAFSYRYFPDGTVEPDARWVAANIVSRRVPVLGVVTCHRLLVPQLQAALEEVVRAGLAGRIRAGQYGGCYVPRFIERDPSGGLSLHTWGIAVDLNVPTNLPGTRGDMDPAIVAVFERWGFRWGGHWTPSDPMHFELAALIQP